MEADKKRFVFTLSKEQFALFSDAAKAKGLSVAGWLRSVALEAVKKEAGGKSRN